jgi:hypothetical protein
VFLPERRPYRSRLISAFHRWNAGLKMRLLLNFCIVSAALPGDFLWLSTDVLSKKPFQTGVVRPRRKPRRRDWKRSLGAKAQPSVTTAFLTLEWRGYPFTYHKLPAGRFQLPTRMPHLCPSLPCGHTVYSDCGCYLGSDVLEINSWQASDGLSLCE